MKKTIRTFLFVIGVTTMVTSYSQRVRLMAAAGGSAYYGDIVQGTPILKQVSPAITLGVSYDLSYQLRARLSMSRLGIKGEDRDNKNINYKERNLDFKNNIYDFNLALEYDILNSYEYALLPYVFGGPGVFFHDPYTTDRYGNKAFLQRYGTEGQGLKSFPDRKPYSLTQFALGFGGGLRYEVNDDITFAVEGFIRKTFTDYLDDVSQNSYVSQATFNAEGNPYSYYLAYRGDEAPISKGFRGESMPRGNPKNKDLFYSLQFKVTYRLANLHIGPDLDFYSRGYQGYPWRNPKYVL